MKQNRKKNQGSAMVSVLIAMAFIAILGSMVMTATLTNYRMKQTNLKTKDTFYSAEQALDEVRVGLQGLVSDAVSEAYLEVLENYNSFDVEKKMKLMESKYFETIWNELAENPADPKKYKISVLDGYLVNTKWQNGSDITQGHGAIITAIDGENKMISYQDSGVVIKNLQVYYRDEKGYVSIITTDIKLVIPNLQFASTNALPDITNYSTIADEALFFGEEGVGARGFNKIEGNVYAGKLQIKSSDVDKGMLRVEFGDKSQLVSKKDFEIDTATVAMGADSEVWTSGITVEASDLLLNGTNNVLDDLNIKGNGSQITIKGQYNGYGNSITEPDKSSAILINGSNTTLKLQDAKTITVAGRAYIGTGKVNEGESGTAGEPEKKINVMTGESIAVKANQLMYLIPGECIGVRKTMENGITTYGNSLYGRNPLTKEQYTEFMKPENAEYYQEIADEVVLNKLGHNLKYYLAYVGNKPKVEKIFVQTNGDTLVYYYMTFATEEKANQFFADYYGINQTKIEEYADFYTNGITMSDPTIMLRLQLAGNAIKFSETTKTSSLQKSTVKNASKRMESNYKNYNYMFNALCTRLITNYNSLTNVKETDLTKNIVFENIVNVPTLKKFVKDNAEIGTPIQTSFEKDGVKALLIHNGLDSTTQATYVYKDKPDVHFIIATGDVRIESDFSGLIIANGKVTIADNVSLKANSKEVSKLLRAYKEVDGTVYNLIGFLLDGKEMLNIVSDLQAGEKVETGISDLVIYENWSKE